MANFIAAIFDKLIGLCLIIFILFTLKKQQAQDPEKRLSGIPIKTIIILCYVGIGICALFILKIFITGAA